ncbi:MAG TPA: SpoIIIAH-like family protein [Oscillospiraceae bacterium]|nr:SpoIIIAH-like family protein [Oscillospiraceae bacterium]
MKKGLNMIVGKKQIILACLTLILGIAIYLNYVLAQSDNAFPVSDTLESGTDSGGEYGDAMLVSGVVADDTTQVDAEAEKASDEYFAQARLDKLKSRDEAVETLETLFIAGDLTKDELAMVAVDAVSLTSRMESESKIENLIKAKGFKDCIVYLDDNAASIIVKTNGLVPSEAAQIKALLLGEVQVESEFIEILEVK